jgi:hypothetical protein
MVFHFLLFFLDEKYLNQEDSKILKMRKLKISLDIKNIQHSKITGQHILLSQCGYKPSCNLSDYD